VGIDRADDDHGLAADRSGERIRSTDVERADTSGESQGDSRRGRVGVEERDRGAYFDQLRAADGDVRHGGLDGELGGWDSAVVRFRDQWEDHQKRWPADQRETVDRSDDPPGSWRGESGRYLDAAANTEVDTRCERIAEVERTVISPAMREIEAADPSRELVGWEHRLKGADRIKDKVAKTLDEQPRLTKTEALADVPDCLRYTFCYNRDRYSEGVVADIGKLKNQGFEPLPVRNTWDGDHYKGLNTRWRDPATGVRMEVQFHTHESYEAKQVTHGIYERQRDPQTSPAELRELHHVQRELVSCIPIPPGALEIR